MQTKSFHRLPHTPRSTLGAMCTSVLCANAKADLIFRQVPTMNLPAHRCDRDPQACEKMISALQAPVQSLVSLKFFPDATHGWDHKMAATFFEPLACKGRGCMNQNQPDSATTREGIADLLDFLSSRMPAR
jgi:dienelactone hydrolase